MELELLLKDYSYKRGINPLTLDSQGVCRFKVNDSCVVAIEKSLDGNGFFIYSTIGILDSGKERQLSLKALEGNLFGRETGRSSLGYSKSGNSLVLFDYLETNETDPEKFSNRLLDFVQHLTYWITKVKDETTRAVEEISMKKHLQELRTQGNVQIFFA